jgi:hypothetical protein
MALTNIPIEQITENHLQALVDNKVLEWRTIEYKAALHDLEKPEDRMEFLADVSSFANADGGDLVYGIEEKAGVPVRLAGVRASDYSVYVPLSEVDGLKRRMEALLSTGISPRLPGLAIKEICLTDEKVALVIRVPRSFVLPHMVVANSENRFWCRTNEGKRRMNVDELRTAFGLGATIEEKAGTFRRSRLQAVQADRTPWLLRDGKRYVIHIVPLSFYDPSARIHLGNADTLRSAFWPLEEVTQLDRFNIDGFVCAGVADANGRVHEYVQVFRNGVIEAAGVVGENDKGGACLWSLEEHLLERLPRWITALRQLEVSAPLAVGVSFLGLRGLTIARDVRYLFPSERERHIFDRDLIEIPEEIVETGADCGEALKRICDATWQACGFEQDPWVDSAGKWIGRN